MALAQTQTVMGYHEILMLMVTTPLAWPMVMGLMVTWGDRKYHHWWYLWQCHSYQRPTRWFGCLGQDLQVSLARAPKHQAHWVTPQDSDSLPEMQASSSPVASKSDWSDLSSETSIMLTFLSECWGEAGEVLTKGDMCPLWESWGPTVVMISGPLWSKSESTSQTITMVWSWHRGQWSPKPSESKLPSSLSHETTRLTWSKEIRLGTVRLLSLCNRWHRSWTLKQWVRVRFYSSI